MKMIFSQNKLFRYIALFSIVSFFLFMTAAAVAQDKETTEQETPEETVPIEIEKSDSDFRYEVDNRADPFAPFVTGTAKKNPVTPDEILEEDEVLTGMQLFEPGQLTLVALMMTGGNTLAMVQDFTGRGYVVEEGMKIGRRGVITEIQEDRLLITETAHTRSGKTLTNEIAMVLKREGEE